MSEERELIKQIYKIQAGFNHTIKPHPMHCPHCKVLKLIGKYDMKLKMELDEEMKGGQDE